MLQIGLGTREKKSCLIMISYQERIMLEIQTILQKTADVVSDYW